MNISWTVLEPTGVSEALNSRTCFFALGCEDKQQTNTRRKKGKVDVMQDAAIIPCTFEFTVTGADCCQAINQDTPAVKHEASTTY